MHPEDLLEAIQEFHMRPEYHKNLGESVEEEINPEAMSIPQDIPENPNNDSSSVMAKVQEDIQPRIQYSQEIENCYTSV